MVAVGGLVFLSLVLLAAQAIHLAQRQHKEPMAVMVLMVAQATQALLLVLEVVAGVQTLV